MTMMRSDCVGCAMIKPVGESEQRDEREGRSQHEIAKKWVMCDVHGSKNEGSSFGTLQWEQSDAVCISLVRASGRKETKGESDQ